MEPRLALKGFPCFGCKCLGRLLAADRQVLGELTRVEASAGKFLAQFAAPLRVHIPQLERCLLRREVQINKAELCDTRHARTRTWQFCRPSAPAGTSECSRSACRAPPRIGP